MYRYILIAAMMVLPLLGSLAAEASPTPSPQNASDKTKEKKSEDKATPKADESNEPSAGEDTSSVQVANLIYAGVHSSVCFSDHFLELAEQDSSISTSRRFHPVKASSADLFKYPFVIMTGEGEFKLLEDERVNLKKFLENGGLLMASASCSSPEWDRSFRVELAKIFPDKPMRAIPMTHKLFKTVYDIKEIKVRHGTPRPLEGVEVGGRIAVLYSTDGLNDTPHVHGCCCCGGNEIANCSEINVNVLAYALTH